MFGENAELYDRARPAYPAALVDDLVTLVGPHARALDVGCGTAKATRLLAERGVTGVALEAHPAMAAVARRHLAAWPGWRVDVGGFEAWEPQDGDAPFDLITCAQAWHWLDPEVRIRKAHDLLRPGGWLAVFWNVQDPDQPAADLVRALEDIYDRHVPGEGLMPVPSEVDPAGAETIPPDRGFDPPLTRDYRWTCSYTTAGWLDLMRTHSRNMLLEPDARERLLAEIGAAIDAHGGAFEYAYLAQLGAARRSR